MKNVFVVLPFGLKNSLEIAQAFVHAIECELDTYCQLIPYHNVPLSFWTQQNIHLRFIIIHFILLQIRELCNSFVQNDMLRLKKGGPQMRDADKEVNKPYRVSQ